MKIDNKINAKIELLKINESDKEKYSDLRTYIQFAIKDIENIKDIDNIKEMSKIKKYIEEYDESSIIKYINSKAGENALYEIFDFLINTRNYLSHIKHNDMKMEDSFTKLKKLLTNNEHIKNKLLEFDTDDILKNYINNIDLNVLFILLILSLILPGFLINYITDNIYFENDAQSNKNGWKILLNSISSNNANKIKIDISIFSKYPSSLFESEEKIKTSSRLALVKDWDYNFMKTAWTFVFPMLRMREEIEESSIVFKKNMSVIRFKTKSERPETYEISKVVLQQILVYYLEKIGKEKIVYLKTKKVHDDGNNDILKEKERKKKNRKSSDTFDKYPVMSKIINYYNLWAKVKKSWISDKNNSDNIHKAVRSFTRYLIREYLLEEINAITEDNIKIKREKERELNKNIFGIVSRNIHFQISKNFDSPMNFDKINFYQYENDVKSFKDKLLNYNGKTFECIFNEYCDNMIKRIPEKKLYFIEEYVNQEKKFSVFCEEKKNNIDENNETLLKENTNAALWSELKKNKPFLAYTYNIDKIKRIKLIKEEKKEPYIVKIAYVINELKGDNPYKKLLENYENIISILNTYKNYTPETERKNAGRKKTKEEKKEYKKNKYKLYTALETALIYICYKKTYDDSFQEMLNKTERLSIKPNEDFPNGEQGLFVYLGEGENENKEKVYFYCRNDNNYKAFFSHQIKKIGKEALKNIFSSYLEKKSPFEKTIKKGEDLKEDKNIAILDNSFISEFISLYKDTCRTILQFESYIVGKNNISFNNSNYVSFKDIAECIKKNKIDIGGLNICYIIKLRKAIIHLNMYESYYIGSMRNKLKDYMKGVSYNNP